MRRHILIASALGVLLGCGDDTGGPVDSGGGVCVPGMMSLCACTNGAMGAQVCNSSGTYDPCICDTGPLDGGPADAEGVDAPMSDASEDGSVDDSGADSAIDSSTDAGAMDSAVDSSTDTGAMDSGMDSSTDGGVMDAGMDTSTGDSATDAGSDTGSPDGSTPGSVIVHTATPCGPVPSATLPMGVTLLADLGQSRDVFFVSRTETRLVSASGYRYVLWDTTTGEQIFSGVPAPNDPFCDPGSCPYTLLALGGDTLVVQQPEPPRFPADSRIFDLRSAVDGALRATVNSRGTPGLYYEHGELKVSAGLSEDAAYFYVASDASLQAWSIDGTPLFEVLGDYGQARVSATASELLVALGPAGDDVVEHVSLAGASTTTSTFAGDFHSWFHDGARFLTTVGTVVRVYSPDAVQEQLLTVPTTDDLGGVGNRFWIDDSGLTVYDVANVTTPLGTVAASRGWRFRVSGGWMLVLDDAGLELLDLTTMTFAATFPLPAHPPLTDAVAASPGGELALGGRSGAVATSTGAGAELRGLGCGRIQDSAGSASGMAAFYTSAAGVILVDASGSPSVLGVLPIRATGLALSADGTRLAVSGTRFDNGETVLQVIELPSGRLLVEQALRSRVHLSDDGASIGLSYSASGGGYRRTVADTDTLMERYEVTTTNNGAPLLSPSGMLAAISQGDGTTQILQDGTLVGAFTGSAFDWLDETRLLARVGSAWAIMSTAGVQTASPTFPYSASVQGLDSNRVFLGHQVAAIHDIDSGVELWTSSIPTPNEAVAAGDYIVSGANTTPFYAPIYLVSEAY